MKECPRCGAAPAKKAMWSTWDCGSDLPDSGEQKGRFRQSNHCIALERDALRDRLEEVTIEADASMERIANMHMQVCQTVEKATRSAPLEWEDALALITRLGNERDQYYLVIQKLQGQASPDGDDWVEEWDADLQTPPPSIDGSPNLVPKPDIKALREQCVSFVQATAQNGLLSKDADHYLFEALMETFYGKDFWDWYNEVVDE